MNISNITKLVEKKLTSGLLNYVSPHLELWQLILKQKDYKQDSPSLEQIIVIVKLEKCLERSKTIPGGLRENVCHFYINRAVTNTLDGQL